MVTPKITVPATPNPATTQQCDCKCDEGPACSLDCIVQPRFYCGQLLTDQDLTALVQWSRDKQRLTRQRHGWGVVCGLDVQADPKAAGHIVVTSGYAVSCCGEDVRVCADTSFDLSDACRQEPPPCEPPRVTAASQRKLAAPGGSIGGATAFYNFHVDTVSTENMRVVDLYIHYAEETAETGTALGRSECGQAGQCEVSRVRESFTLTAEPVLLEGDPTVTTVNKWVEQYHKCLAVIEAFQAAFPQRLPDQQPAQANQTRLAGLWRPDDIRRWLQKWLQAHPLQHFYGLWDTVCNMPAEDLISEAQIARILFWIVQDCRNTFLACDCHTCTTDHGVPLARIWLASGGDRGTSTCRVMYIDVYPPFRRLIGPDCWPAYFGMANLGAAIWRRTEESYALLERAGVRMVDDVQIEMPSTVKDLAAMFDRDVIVPSGARVTVVWLDAGFAGPRIVGFRATEAAPMQIEADQGETKPAPSPTPPAPKPTAPPPANPPPVENQPIGGDAPAGQTPAGQVAAAGDQPAGAAATPPAAEGPDAAAAPKRSTRRRG
jgi:hypothetical protein